MVKEKKCFTTEEDYAICKVLEYPVASKAILNESYRSLPFDSGSVANKWPFPLYIERMEGEKEKENRNYEMDIRDHFLPFLQVPLHDLNLKRGYDLVSSTRDTDTRAMWHNEIEQREDMQGNNQPPLLDFLSKDRQKLLNKCSYLIWIKANSSIVLKAMCSIAEKFFLLLFTLRRLLMQVTNFQAIWQMIN